MTTEDFLDNKHIKYYYDDGKLITNIDITGNLDIDYRSISKDLFSNCIIYGNLWFDKLEEVHPDFLFGTTIIGGINSYRVNLSFDRLKKNTRRIFKKYYLSNFMF